MAIILISKERKQRKLRWVNIVVAMLPFVISSLIIIIIEVQSGYNEILEVYNKNISIDFSVVDSNEVKNLQLFEGVKTEFEYSAEERDGKHFTGKISAVNEERAKSILEEMGFKVLSIQQANAGRAEPFNPYY